MAKLTIPISIRDHAQGRTSASVTVVEYGDYEHPACTQATRVIKRLQAELGDDLRFVFRHFPRPKLYLNDLHAAFAAEAASMQGKFWAMHDKLYTHPEALQDHELIEYAADLGLEVEKFISDMDSIAVRLKVHRDVQSGLNSGVRETPAFYVNGQLQPSW